MARQDIQIDTVYGELETTDIIVGKNSYDFMLLESLPGSDNDNFRYGEITIPKGHEKKVVNGFQAHISIPYTPYYKELKVRFRVASESDTPEYMINKTDNGIWFRACLPEGRQIRMSELRKLNERNYNLILMDGVLWIYSGKQTDLLIKASLGQNQTFLLKASAGNLYQHPLTGVGLIDYLHGNFENTGLAAKLQSEFEADKMVINNAYMDSATGELLLDVEEYNG
ncbi:MAG: hypothetical protein RR559_07250 [Bacteroides sp.]